MIATGQGSYFQCPKIVRVHGKLSSIDYMEQKRKESLYIQYIFLLSRLKMQCVLSHNTITQKQCSYIAARNDYVPSHGQSRKCCRRTQVVLRAWGILLLNLN